MSRQHGSSVMEASPPLPNPATVRPAASGLFVAALATALVICVVSLRAVVPRDMGDLGLVQVLPGLFWVGLGVVVVSFAVCLARPSTPEWLLAAHVVVFIIILYGSTSFITDIPRGSTSWRHAGITSELIKTGHPDALIDAYFSWPGFFMLAAFASKAAGLASPLSLALWAPMVVNLLILGPLLMVLRTFTVDRRLIWFAAWIFFGANWINQDYFAPQSFAYLLYLTAMAILLTWFDPVRRTWHPHRVGLAVVVLLVCLAMVPAHQLTPFALLLAVSSLVLVRRCSLRGLPLILAVAIAGWVIFGAHVYLAGHVGKFNGDLTSLLNVLSANVGSRVQGSDGHLEVVRIRLALTGALWVLAILGAIRRYRAGHRDVSCATLAVSPFLLFLSLQPYGGELLLRIFLYSLPFVGFLVAGFILPPAFAASPVPVALRVLAFSVLLIPTLVVARFGNERMDEFSAAEVRAVHRLYQIAPLGSHLTSTASSTPWKYRGYSVYSYDSIVDLWAADRNVRKTSREGHVRDITAYLTKAGRAHGEYVLFTRSGLASVQLLGELHPSVIHQVEAALQRAPGWSLALSNRDASIYAYPARNVG